MTAEPAPLRLLKGRGNGTDSGGRKVPTPPPFQRVPPEPPEWLDGDALDMWNLVVPELGRLDLIKPTDQAALAAFCVSWMIAAGAAKVIQERLAEGKKLTYEARQGVIPIPEIAIYNNSADRVRQFAKEFGLTPSAEQKIAQLVGDNSDVENPFA